MHRTACTFGRAFSFTFFSALLFTAPAYADAALLSADFDGDGHGDHVTFNIQHPTVVRVWLSATETTEFVHSTEPLLRVAAADLDGDHRAELIASNGSSLLRIWTKRQKRFRAYRPQHQTPAGVSRGSDGASAARPAPPVPTTGTSRPVGASLASSAYLGAVISAEWHAPRVRRRATSSQPVIPLAPRPPPVSAA